MATTPDALSRPHSGDSDQLGRLVPADIEAEACVLGSMILDAPCIDIVVQLLHEEFFHRPAHGIIYRCLQEMHDESKPIDLVTLREELQRRKQLDPVGGVHYLVALAEGVPGVANVEYYARIVRDKALLRSLIRVSREIINDAYDSADEAEKIIDQSEQKIFEVAEAQITNAATGLGELLSETFETLEASEGQSITGLASGYQQLDELTAGFQNGEMIILAARPSMGKTALLLNIAEYMAVVDKHPIAFFSLEMSKMQVTQRLLASYSRFDLRRMRRATITDDDWINLKTAAGELHQANFLIDDSSTLTATQLRAKARRLYSRYDVRCILIDYLQLMTYTGRADNRQEQIAETSRAIKALARELNIPVICAAQLNRGPADRPTHTPRMSDLRESGSIEQDADVVMLLHNEDYYHRADTSYEKTGLTNLIIEKQRNGPTGVVDLVFHPECTRFDSAAPEHLRR